MVAEKLGGSRLSFLWLCQKVKDRADSDVQSAYKACMPSMQAAYLSLPVSLTAFGLRVLLSNDINIASTTWNNVGTSCSFQNITQGCHFLRVTVETSLCFVGLKFEGLIFPALSLAKLAAYIT